MGDADDETDDKDEDLRKLLEREDVKTFLDQAEEAATSGRQLDWDVTFKVANLRYYRTHFERKREDRTAEAELATEWMLRALNFNPLHVDLSGEAMRRAQWESQSSGETQAWWPRRL